MAAMAFHPPAASYAVLKRGQDPAKPTVAPIATQIMTGGDAGPPDADPGPSNVQGGETFALEAASDELWAGPPLPTPDTADDEDSGLGEYKVIITNREIKRLCRELNALKPTEATRITTSSGTTISGLFVRAQGVTARHTLLFSHGNAVDIGEMLPFWALMSANLGVNVFGYEYTGYGDSTGAEAPTEDQTYRDIQAAYDHVASVTSTSIVLYGQSVGSGPTCHLASRRKVAGVILHSPMASGLRVLRPPQEQCTANICHPSCCLSCCDIFPNSNRIANASAPVLILHGLEDEVIHVGNAHLLHKKTPTPFKVDPWLVPGGGHNNLFDTDPDGYWVQLAQFLASLESRVDA